MRFHKRGRGLRIDDPRSVEQKRASNMLQGRSSLQGHFFLQARQRQLNQKSFFSLARLSSQSSSLKVLP